ncbi:DUF1499 domain-containing protein [Notoacmeibacter sp. MSK16QG-6]|uniref:DUF1499 domain-containing protein n=1 Tax=Notoacmeibacter sp. MSK16QG-6 TaxID=2957982 RepID=UPI0020A1C7A1|nr:DUF1499 domain-containing protein [Notoacmeibacter sp. MSK16QG-6]MCP1199844.1 DUF1499 domain-containing protein [Notoacmeibacter sp. MSK16QG-6]
MTILSLLRGLVKIALIIIASLVAFVLAAFLFLVLYGRTTGWETKSRKADQDIYDFAAGRRSATDNDALACSEGLCDETDIVLPVPSAGPEKAFAALERNIAADSDKVERVDDKSDPFYRRYVVRTQLMRFPDTVDIRWSPEGWRAMSRSLIGRSDFGGNEKRLRRWFGVTS